MAQAGLRAGSVDDNVDFVGFLTYLARIHDLGISTRDFDPTGRVVVTVVGTSGLPVAGAPISVTSGGTEIASLRTTADGTARFLPLRRFLSSPSRPVTYPSTRLPAPP